MLDPIPSEQYPGFFIIRGYSKYAANMDGYIIRLETGRYVKIFKKPTGYLFCHLVADDDKKCHLVFLHRAIMLAFKYPDKFDPKDMTIDHINGNKMDNRPENLEWVTREENKRRALANGADIGGSHRTPIETLCPRTMERKVYASKAECTKALNISLAALNDRLAMGPQKVFPDGLQIRLQSDEPWEPNLHPFGLVPHGGQSCAVWLKSVESGALRRFDNLISLAKFLGIAPSTLSLAQNKQLGKTQFVYPGGYVFKFEAEEANWVEFDYWECLRQAYPMFTCPEVADLTSGWLYRYETLEQVETAYDLRKTAAQYRTMTKGLSLFQDRTVWGLYPEISNIFHVPLTNNRQMPLPPNCWELLKEHYRRNKSSKANQQPKINLNDLGSTTSQN